MADTQASLHTAEVVVARQTALLATASELIEEARRWSRSLWDDGPASDEPVIVADPGVAPAWLTEDGQSQGGMGNHAGPELALARPLNRLLGREGNRTTRQAIEARAWKARLKAERKAERRAAKRSR